jgi:putative oxidoreductase|tara:strand:+ start:449 stop:715 length:267 start_codon:yes stop_codon:yes gene_type:complete
VEFFGGLLILIGLWTHLAALFATFTMLIAYLTAHAARFQTLNNGELAAMYFTAFLVIFTFVLGPLALIHGSPCDSKRQTRDKMAKNKV